MGEVISIAAFKARQQKRQNSGVVQIPDLVVTRPTISMGDLEYHVSVEAVRWKDAILAGHLKVEFNVVFSDGAKMRFRVGKRGVV